MMTEPILVIDDEPQIRILLEITLTAQGYRVAEASDGKEGLALAASLQPSMILLDLGLPGMNGMEVLARLREWYLKPVIILSVRSAEEDIVNALDLGATDYLSKPFRTGELLARIRAALRLNPGTAASPVVTVGNLSVDLESHIARKDGQVVKLTPTEFSLLALFVKYEGRVLTHQYILNAVWGAGYLDQTQYLRVFVAQLRKKIENDPVHPSLLVTESGIGYRFGG